MSVIPFVGVFSLSSKGWLVRFCGESLPLAATAWAATPSSGEASPQRPSSLNPPPAARVASAPPDSRHLSRCFRCSFVLTSRRAGPAASPRSIPSTQSHQPPYRPACSSLREFASQSIPAHAFRQRHNDMKSGCPSRHFPRWLSALHVVQRWFSRRHLRHHLSAILDGAALPTQER